MKKSWSDSCKFRVGFSMTDVWAWEAELPPQVSQKRVMVIRWWSAMLIFSRAEQMCSASPLIQSCSQWGNCTVCFFGTCFLIFGYGRRFCDWVYSHFKFGGSISNIRNGLLGRFVLRTNGQRFKNKTKYLGLVFLPVGERKMVPLAKRCCAFVDLVLRNKSPGRRNTGESKGKVGIQERKQNYLNEAWEIYSQSHQWISRAFECTLSISRSLAL